MKKQYMLVVDLALWIVFVASLASAQTSSWTDPNVDRTVPAGQTVVIDSQAVARSVIIDGTLKASRSVSSHLTVTGQIVVNPTGVLDQGTEADPIRLPATHRVTFALEQGQVFVGGANYSADPGIWNRGIWTAYGQETKRSWGKLVADAAAGSSSVTVEGDVSDWPVGAEVVITHTAFVGDGSVPQVELRTIQDVEGSTLTLTAPLSYAHAGTGLNRGEVGLVSRNVIIETDLQGYVSQVGTPLQADMTARRFACTRIWENGQAHLGYAQFSRMGSTAVDGCFALHWHRLYEAGYGQWARGLSFMETGFRSTNIHESHGVMVEDTVSVFSGNGIVHWVQTDPVSTQKDHAYIHNLVVAHQHQAGDPDDPAPGESGFASGFWPGVSDHEAYLGNVAAGIPSTRVAGFTFAAGTRATFSDAVGSIGRTFLRNEAHSYTWQGIFSIGSRQQLHAVDHVDTRVWGNYIQGVFSGSYLYPLKWHRLRVAGSYIGVTGFAASIDLQDTTIVGSGPTHQREAEGQTGVEIRKNFGYPFQPTRLERVSINNLTPALSGAPGIGVAMLYRRPGAGELCASPQLDLFFATSECEAPWLVSHKLTVGAGITPKWFGMTGNPNDIWFDFDAMRVYLRHDQTATSSETSRKFFVPGVTVYDASVDALSTPMSAYAPFTWYGLVTQPGRLYGPFDVSFTHNEPPSVELATSLTGRTLTMTATPSADTTKVEYFIDYIKVGETTAAPHQVTVDLAQPLPGDIHSPRRYGYAYVRALDGSEVNAGCGDTYNGVPDCRPSYAQRGYSTVLEIGPEVLVANQPPPTTEEQLQQLLQQVAALTQRVVALEACGCVGK